MRVGPQSEPREYYVRAGSTYPCSRQWERVDLHAEFLPLADVEYGQLQVRQHGVVHQYHWNLLSQCAGALLLDRSSHSRRGPRRWLWIGFVVAAPAPPDHEPLGVSTVPSSGSY